MKKWEYVLISFERAAPPNPKEDEALENKVINSLKELGLKGWRVVPCTFPISGTGILMEREIPEPPAEVPKQESAKAESHPHPHDDYYDSM